MMAAHEGSTSWFVSREVKLTLILCLLAGEQESQRLGTSTGIYSRRSEGDAWLVSLWLVVFLNSVGVHGGEREAHLGGCPCLIGTQILTEGKALHDRLRDFLWHKGAVRPRSNVYQENGRVFN